MTRRHIHTVLLAAVILTLGARAAIAQIPVHPGAPHPMMHPHDSTHAALHALLMGKWTGTVIDASGGTMPLEWSMSTDSLHGLLLTFHHHTTAGEAAPMSVRPTNFAVRGDTLSWSQPFGDTSCRTTAVIARPPAQAPRLRGRVVCGETAMPFSLQKQLR